MRRNTVWHSLLTLFILLPLLAACGKKGKTEPTWEPVTITFAGLEMSPYRNLVEQFEAANPDIRVKLITLEPKSYSLMAIQQVDTMIGWPSASFTRWGLVQDLSPFIIEAGSAFQPEDFYPHTLESLQWDEGTWGMPFDVHFQVILYDREAFDQADVPYPQPGWTWDDFLSKAQALTRREGEDVLRWGFVWWRRDLLPFIQGRVGSLVDASA